MEDKIITINTVHGMTQGMTRKLVEHDCQNMQEITEAVFTWGPNSAMSLWTCGRYFNEPFQCQGDTDEDEI